MGLLDDLVSPSLNDWLLGEEVRPLRARAVALATGRVLELGAGTGLNFALYPAGAEVHAVEPDPAMAKRAKRRAREAGATVTVHDANGRALPFPDEAFDTLFCTFVLCSVKQLPAVLSEAKRVLRPGGRLVTLEHVVSPDPSVARWQRRLDPVWRALAGGCRLARDPVQELTDAGFGIEQADRLTLPLPRIAEAGRLVVARR